MPSLIVHGHFYQPPRENPWTGVIEEQPGAAPFHDWNERIHSECYRANAFATISDPKTGAAATVNNYEHISFNFGPTLLGWIEATHAETYARIIDADRKSVARRHGHGNALAQAYGHPILTLCNERDLVTQIRWGLADFRHRFNRDAEAMWLPETACNDRVLEALIDEGLRFVILAPHQAARVRYGTDRTRAAAANDEWRKAAEEGLDTSTAYLYRHRRRPETSIAIFFYDGRTSRAIAFENLLRSSRGLVEAFLRSVDDKAMINVATDGETYGHHFKFGDICLAHALEIDAPAAGLSITNYGEYLEAHGPTGEVEIDNGPDGKGSSWSCPHGVGRWNSDCGCHTGGQSGWDQNWRTPLRQALDFLRDNNEAHFDAARGKVFQDPWQTRDDSIALVLDDHRSRELFLFEHAGRWLSAAEQHAALTYLELQRMLLLMYSSCGWFFNDISGIETLQVLSYAARALDLMDQLNLPSVRERFLEILGEAKSNRKELGSGADVFRSLSRQRMKTGNVEERIRA